MRTDHESGTAYEVQAMAEEQESAANVGVYRIWSVALLSKVKLGVRDRRDALKSSAAALIEPRSHDGGGSELFQRYVRTMPLGQRATGSSGTGRGLTDA